MKANIFEDTLDNNNMAPKKRPANGSGKQKAKKQKKEAKAKASKYNQTTNK